MSSLLAVVIGVGAGIWVTQPAGRAFRPLLETVAAVGQTFPPVAVPVMGFSAKPAVIALVLYGLLPIVQATIAGIETVPASLHNSATGAVMSRGKILRRLELPLAAPVIISGIRTSVIINIGTAAIASTVGVKSLGSPMIISLSGFNTAYVLQGALLRCWRSSAICCLNAGCGRWTLAMDDDDIARQHDAAGGTEREQGNHAENGGFDKLHGHPYMQGFGHYKYSPRRYKIDATASSQPGRNDVGSEVTFPGRKQRRGRLPLTRSAV